MKKLHLKEIHNTLSISKNKLGISLDFLYKSHPYQISFDIFSDLILKDKYIEIDKNKKVKLKAEYYSTNDYTIFEEKHYNSSYLKTLFKEETNTIKLCIYKLLVDSPQLTYQQISSEMLHLYGIALDIKQVSHYCMELMKIKLIISNQSSTIEKINQINQVSFEYNDRHKLDYKLTNHNGGCVRNNITFDYRLSHDPLNILHFDKNELMSENKLFLSNRFSFIVDENEIKNNVLFHLLINKDKGLTGNEICLLCDFIGREKTINKIIVGLEKEGKIIHKVLREGKKMEFVYFIINTQNIDEKIKRLVEFYLNEHNNCFQHKCIANNEETINKNHINNISLDKINNSNNRIDNGLKLTKDKELNEKRNIHQNTTFNNDNISGYYINNIFPINSINNQNNISTGSNIIQKTTIDESILIPSSVNHFEKLNEEDYLFIKNSLNENKIDKTINEEILPETQKKTIMMFLSSYIESTKNFSNSAYNRYIFIINQVREKKVLTLNDVKHLILTDLEKEKDYIIDRKTIKRIFINLQKMKLIKIMKFELTMKNTKQSYLHEKDEIRQEKLIALRRDLDENDQNMLEDIMERLKPPKKSIDETKIAKVEKQNDPIKEEIEKIKQQAEGNITINEIQRNITIFVMKVGKILGELKKNYNKGMYYEVFIKIMRFCSVKKHVELLYERKDILSIKNNNSSEQIEKLYTYIEGSIPSNIIVPKYIKSKLISHNDVKCTTENSDRNNDLFKYYSNNYTKNLLRNIHFEFNKETNTIKKGNNEINLLNKKRKFEDGFGIINKNKFDFKRWNKLIDIYELVKEIYFIPGITFRKLKKKMHLSNEYDGAETEILLYLHKMGIIIIENKNTSSKQIIDTSSISIDPNYKLFIEIYL